MTSIHLPSLAPDRGVNHRHYILRVGGEREDLSCTHACNAQVKLKNPPLTLYVSGRPKLSAYYGERLKLFDPVAFCFAPRVGEIHLSAPVRTVVYTTLADLLSQWNNRSSRVPVCPQKITQTGALA